MKEKFLLSDDLSAENLQIPDEIVAKERHLVRQDCIIAQEQYGIDSPAASEEVQFKLIKRWIGYVDSHLVSEEVFLQVVLDVVGVERDEEDKLLLYHATPYKNLLEILESSKISPHIEHNHLTMGYPDYSTLLGEKANLRQFQKVYLSNQANAIKTAKKVQLEALGQSVYILKVNVGVDNLDVDEDSYQGNQKYPWIFSICRGTCSHVGDVEEFDIVGRIPNISREHYNSISIEKLCKQVPGLKQREIEMKIGGVLVTEEEEQRELLKKGVNIANISNLNNNKLSGQDK